MLPAAASLKRQGANKGATTAFLISTPESGVDSIAVTYALLDPLMTVIRPVAAFVTAMVGGMLENRISYEQPVSLQPIMMNPGQEDGCGKSGGEERSAGLSEKIKHGFGFAVNEVWAGIALWFFLGVLLAGCITALIPDDYLKTMLGGGFSSMILMLVFGIPLYICATASTPIAAALILKGVSPGAALVFLLVGPATNITSLSVLVPILGKKSTLRYLVVVAMMAVVFGLGIDWIYTLLNISPKAVIGTAGEVVPHSVQTVAACILIGLSIKPFYHFFRKIISGSGNNSAERTGCNQ